MGSLQGLINRAYGEEGYIEKASNSSLDSKTGNKGTNNYTKYARDVNNAGLAGCQAQAWCGTFQFALEMYEFGVDQALKNWHMTKSSYVGYNCFSTYNTFAKYGKTSKTPKVGALVIFTQSHMGRVVKVSGNKFWTIEGNTSPAAYERNGGMVKEKSYSIYDSKIKGFCIIDYDGNTATTTPSSKNYLSVGDKGTDVRNMQNMLIALGYSCGSSGADGDFGSGTEKAVKAFQKAKGLTVDGQYGTATKAALTSAYNANPANGSTSGGYKPNIEKGQKWLNENYMSVLKKSVGSLLTVDGSYGTKTRQACVAVWKDVMNRKYGTNFDIKNPNFLDSCKASASKATLSFGSCGTFTYIVQLILSANDLYRGKMDADYGNEVESGVRTFQGRNGLTMDGCVGANTWYKLFN